MRIYTKYKKHLRTVCISLLLLAFLGCTNDKLNEFGPGNTTGKVVMVSLNVSLPPAEEPTFTSEYAVVKPYSRNGSNSDSPFTVVLEKGQENATTRVSDGTTELHNLWLFQFKEDGSINGNPHKLSDGVTAINDMVTIDVPLVVAENQTLYVLVLGPKLNYDMSGVSSLTDLKNWSFDYLTNVGGHTQSLITAEDEVPLAGEASGVTVVDIDGGNRGLVEYNKPVGFVGGIEIKKLMARITLRYKFEVESYKLQGLKLLNVNRTIRLTNPSINTSSDSYATLERDTFGTPDPNGLYTSTWYVAQNCQGTVTSILSENQRYYKKVNNTVSGTAPPLGTQIEAWAYSTATTDEYAIYQMYVGNNNTDNFDVEPNHFYNLRTTIDADINSAKNDERIRAYTATQYVEFHASQNVSVGGGAKFDYMKYNKAGTNYDFDAAYDVRPLVIQTQGRAVEVGIYTDASCMQKATPGNSWLRLSSSSNYTDAHNNVKEPLDTYLKTGVILPTQVKFYLYSDEYIYDNSGNLLDPGGTSDAGGKRSLYIKVTTTTNGDGGTIQASHIFKMDQRPAIYAGHFGGEKGMDGSYTMGLVHDRLSVRAYKYLEDIAMGRIEYGYDNIETAKNSYETDNMDYGKTATVKLAENINNLTWTGNIPVPQKDASGHVLLYQYQYPASTFSARACYDKNRDEDGNGRIEGDEIKWYLPASNQLIGLYVGSLINSDTGGATTEDGTGSIKRWYNGINSYYKHQTSSSRCVRDIPQKPFQTMGIYTDVRGNNYAAIYSGGLPESKVEVRTTNPDFYTNIQLYEYTVNGQNTNPVKDANGNSIFVNRVKRHDNTQNSGTHDMKVSKSFIVSPDLINSDGGIGNVTMDWATANGYLATANSNKYDVASFAVPKGCAMYRGKDGNDEPGTWRVPTLREGYMMMIYYKELEATNAQTGFKAFALTGNNNGTSYWLATEYSGNSSEAFYIKYYPDATQVKYTSTTIRKSTKYYLRCIRDIIP